MYKQSIRALSKAHCIPLTVAHFIFRINRVLNFSLKPKLNLKILNRKLQLWNNAQINFGVKPSIKLGANK